MKKSLLMAGALAGASLLAAGWAFAEPRPGHGAGQGMGHGMGYGMNAGGPQNGGGQNGAGEMVGHAMMGRHMSMMEHGGGMGSGSMRHDEGQRAGSGRGAGSNAANLDDARARLAITPAQEAAWTKYAEAVRAATAADMSARDGVDPALAGKLTPQERFEYGSRLREANQASAEKVRTAAAELFATLDAGQKSSAQEILPGLGRQAGNGPVRGADAGHGPVGGSQPGRGPMAGHGGMGGHN